MMADDGGDDGSRCNLHPYRTHSPGGGICALCLQEKLGKLISSSSASLFDPPRPYPSSSSPSPASPSFRSDFSSSTSVAAAPSAAAASAKQPNKFPSFFATHNKNKKQQKQKGKVMLPVDDVPSSSASEIVFQRSKSMATTTTTPLHGGGGHRSYHYTPKKKGGGGGFFSSFFSLSSSDGTKRMNIAPPGNNIKLHDHVVYEYENTKEIRDLGRSLDGQVNACAPVSRSRSVGCGSRSFSGDFFERISTGFGDCTALRRVESQREPGNNNISLTLNNIKPPRSSTSAAGRDGQRVRCGGIFFGGFAYSSSNSISSSSNSSSTQWVSSSSNNSAEDGANASARPPPPPPSSSSSLASHHHNHRRNKSWGWSFGSPMRSFGRPSNHKNGSRRSLMKQGGPSSSTSNQNAAATAKQPNLAAIPSLLAVGG